MTKTEIELMKSLEKDVADYSDCTFDELCNLHDDAVECDDYAWAGRLSAVLAARPEYPAYREQIRQLLESFDLELPEQSEVPF